MNRFEKRKIKTTIYKHSNAIMYSAIFVLASIITIAAAMNRTDEIMYIDETKLAVTKEAVEVIEGEANKVAATETEDQITTEAVTEMTSEAETEPEITQAPETEPQTESVRVKITADTLKVRKDASQDAEVLGLVGVDEEFEVISQNGQWVEIDYNGGSGFVSAEFVEIME